DIISFLGRKTAKEIPKILCDSDILVLARPDNNQAKAGFPTKLGEYLASGKPVVITDTGEVSRYLSNNISAYLARPDDVKDFAEKILFALSDQNASKIGRKGFEIAKENFNYQLYGNQILKIVRS
ncbi:MAG: glycosyltransferase family 4 protein, partial [Ginsengibacter sp.]